MRVLRDDNILLVLSRGKFSHRIQLKLAGFYRHILVPLIIILPTIFEQRNYEKIHLAHIISELYIFINNYVKFFIIAKRFGISHNRNVLFEGQ